MSLRLDDDFVVNSSCETKFLLSSSSFETSRRDGDDDKILCDGNWKARVDIDGCEFNVSAAMNEKIIDARLSFDENIFMAYRF